MDIKAKVAELVQLGYKRASARAKIAHDIVLAAIRASGMKDKVTIKGGVVMSGMTKAVRRATMDMDADFIRYSLGDAAVIKFVKGLNAQSDCTIEIDGQITELRQQEYRGKRLYLKITDASGTQVMTKLDLGVHTRMEVLQRDFKFDIVTDEKNVKLFVNSKEQIFAEKLKSLLRLGTLSSRYKDVFDMYYLIGKMNKKTLKKYFDLYIYQDRRMRERTPEAIVRRISEAFSDRMFSRQLRNKKFAWLDVDPAVATKALTDYILTIR